MFALLERIKELFFHRSHLLNLVDQPSRHMTRSSTTSYRRLIDVERRRVSTGKLYFSIFSRKKNSIDLNVLIKFIKMFKTIDGVFIGFMLLVAVIGILGNVFTVYVMIKKKLLKGRLWYYLLSLSCSDIFSFTVIMPLTMLWFYHDEMDHKRFLCNLQGSSMNFLMGWSLITIGFVNIGKYRCVKTPVTDKKKGRRRLMIYIFTFPNIFIYLYGSNDGFFNLCLFVRKKLLRIKSFKQIQRAGIRPVECFLTFKYNSSIH